MHTHTHTHTHTQTNTILHLCIRACVNQSMWFNPFGVEIKVAWAIWIELDLKLSLCDSEFNFWTETTSFCLCRYELWSKVSIIRHDFGSTMQHGDCKPPHSLPHQRSRGGQREPRGPVCTLGIRRRSPQARQTGRRATRWAPFSLLFAHQSLSPHPWCHAEQAKCCCSQQILTSTTTLLHLYVLIHLEAISICSCTHTTKDLSESLAFLYYLDKYLGIWSRLCVLCFCVFIHSFVSLFICLFCILFIYWFFTFLFELKKNVMICFVIYILLYFFFFCYLFFLCFVFVWLALSFI